MAPPNSFRKQFRANADDKRFSVFEPVTPDECQRINSETYEEIQVFLQSNSYLTTGASVFGWRDRRKVEGGGERLKFSLTKVFPGATALDLSQRSWAIVASPREHRSLHSASLNARLFCAQHVDAHNVLIYRVFYSECGKYAAKSLFLVSRFEIENGGFVVLLRSIDKDRLRTNLDEELFEDQADVLVEHEQWIDVFSW